MAENTITLLVGGSIELALTRDPKPKLECVVTVRYQGFTATARGNQMYTMPVDMYIDVQVSYVDKNNNPAVVDGPVTWATSDDTVVRVRVDGTDSSKCTVASLGKIGTAQVTATADADLGAGVRELVTILDMNIVAGEAVAGIISVTSDPQPVTPSR